MSGGGSASASADGDTVLEVRGLRRAYGARVAVDDLSFSVRRGEAFGLLGPNGAGKSTTFHLLAGLLRADAGELRLDGRVVSPMDPAVRARFGVVFQRPSVNPKLSARENLQLGAALYGFGRARAAARAAELLAWMDLTDRADDRVETFSGGMRRRLELARALAHNPDIVVMDEPTAGVDPATFARLWSRLHTLRRERQLTLLVTTHRPDEAEQCERLAVLDRGRLVACDTPDALRARVGGDVVAVAPSASGPTLEALAAELTARLGLTPRLVSDGAGGRLAEVEVAEGHTLVPRIVEAFPAGAIARISLRRPTLADAFLAVTGTGLDAEPAADVPPPSSKGRARAAQGAA